ncbi:Protein of unknown function DUF262 [Duganella sp. CF402]|uniref:DUF262 domain-containing protein n=1 Tax=unclassified Duganella TaxID=2636909 RepID=UPI0008BE52A4|nr:MULTISPECIES: DUF262 domain-containing protein [unclassified Duganella]RZT06300.1 uncharacterized protein DUF262 [Duganella sp. BK701]SEM68510.1 Protein of unknown function DUF262 [Duganella sp. CF402]
MAAVGPLRQIISVKKLLCDQTLFIPSYQRPYKWTIKNVNQLFADIAAHQTRQSYRLGTIVFHRDAKGRNIVDGQQRIITLLLAVRALLNNPQKFGSAHLRELAAGMFKPEFSSEISKANIYKNYHEIMRIVAREDFTEALTDFLLTRCEVVTFELDDVSEAFQFFDSQNARGRDLDPHDLLKAYHLREFDDADAHLMAASVARWESTDTGELKKLFAHYLYRVRSWCRGEPARYFSKDDILLFKGVSLSKSEQHPYVAPLRLVHQAAEFPFQLDQIIINGRRFFEMMTHYQDKMTRIRGKAPLAGLSESAAGIIKMLNTYPGRKGSGDAYVRQMFDCLLMYYMDKFGAAGLSHAVEKIFIWAYSLRLKREAVQLASMDNHVLENNLFKTLRDAVHPGEFLSCSLPQIDKQRWDKAGEVVKRFKEMGYL